MHDPTAAGGPIESPATSAPVPPESRHRVSAGLALGQAANAAACIAAGLGAGLPGCRSAAAGCGRTAIIRYLAPAHHHPQRQ